MATATVVRQINGFMCRRHPVAICRLMHRVTAAQCGTPSRQRVMNCVLLILCCSHLCSVSVVAAVQPQTRYGVGRHTVLAGVLLDETPWRRLEKDEEKGGGRAGNRHSHHGGSAGHRH